jgi:membrane protease YdiL (CAAX protease family)
MKKGDGKKLLLGLIAVFILFQVVASMTNSVRGEAGVLVGMIVVIATLKVERFLFSGTVVEAARSIGLARPKASGMIVAMVIAKLMFLSVAIFAWQTGSTIEMYPNWPLLMIGIFFQAGIGEETLFRGYLFGHLRQRHTFGKAVFFAAIPFVIVHLILFYQLSWSLAGASILLSIAMSFLFSKLFEISGDTIWAPAIVHFAAQAIAKMFVASGENAWLYPFFCIAVSAVVPLGVYMVPLIVRSFGRKRSLAPVAVSMLLLSFASVSFAQDSSVDFWSQPELTGDWDGVRTQLRERGVTGDLLIVDECSIHLWWRSSPGPGW